MDLSNLHDVKLTYLSLKPTESGLTFSIDGKESNIDNFQKYIRSIVSFTSTMSYTPIVAKVEILDKDEFYIHSLSIPILPAFFDIKEESDVEIAASEDYQKLAKQRARSLNAGQINQLVDERTAQYINYIQHEFAAAYINCMMSKQRKIATQIHQLPIMKQFDLSKFSTSTTLKRTYKTSQFIKHTEETFEEPVTRVHYVGLQEKVPEQEKTPEFWKKVQERDIESLILDASMNYTIELLNKKYGEIEFLPPTASLNVEKSPAND